MKKTLLMLLCLVLGMQHLRAQSPAVDWVSHIGGTTDAGIIAMKHDASGNQYVLGSFTETVFIGSYPLNAPSQAYDAFYLAKYSPDGEVIWAKSVSNWSGDYGNFSVNDMAVSANGMVTLAGTYSKTLELGGSAPLTTSDKLNIFYARYSEAGNLEWVRSLGSDAGEETANGVAIDGKGNVYLTGHLYGDVHLDKPDTKIVYTAYAMKITQAGVIEWVSENTVSDEYKEEVETYQFHVYDEYAIRAFGYDIEVDHMGNVVVAGKFNRYVTWGDFTETTFPRVYVEGGMPYQYDVFLTKLSPEGAPIWLNMLDGSYELGTSFNTLNIDKEGNIYLAGDYQSVIQYNNLKLNTKSADFLGWDQEESYVLKINPQGNGLWITGTTDAVAEDVYQRDYNNTVQSLAISPMGKVYVTGFYAGNATMFGNIKVTPTPGMRERYVAELSAENGNWLWIEGLQVNLATKTNGAVSTDKEGDLYLAAEFNKVMLGDTTLEANMAHVDVFVSKWNIGGGTVANQKVTGFTLVNASTNSDIMDLKDGDILYLDQLHRRLNIRANTSPDQVGSVALKLNDGPVRTENEAPYALAGDRNGNYHAMPQLMPGHYTLSATPYSEMNRRGEEGETLTIHFEVREQQEVIRFILVDAHSNQDIMEINNGTILYLDQLPSRLNVRAEIMRQGVNSVVLQLNNRAPRLENEAPYALAGDRNGDYHTMNPGFSAGMQTLSAKAYAGMRARGNMQAEREIQFEVIDNNSRTMAASGSLREGVSGSILNTEVSAYPNPFIDKVHIEVSVAESGRVALEVFDLQGRSVKHIFEGTMEAGSSQSFEFDGTNLTNGIYITRVIAGGQVKHQRIVLSK
jgi:hypothetical protein